LTGIYFVYVHAINKGINTEIRNLSFNTFRALIKYNIYTTRTYCFFKDRVTKSYIRKMKEFLSSGFFGYPERLLELMMMKTV
jgi:hypothetical protein